MENRNEKIERLLNQAAQSDETYSVLSQDLRLMIEKVTQSLPELGPRFLKKSGPGLEFFEAKEYRPGDDVRAINARLSARSPVPIVVHKQAEIRQHVFLARIFSDSAQYRSEKADYSVDTACNILLFALANHLVKNEEVVSILNSSSLYRGGDISSDLADHLLNVSASTQSMPQILNSVPKDSTIIVFGDFITDKIEVIEKGLDHLRAMGLKGYLVMVADPQLLEFDFEENTKFTSCTESVSLKEETDIVFNQNLKQQYLPLIRKYIEDLKQACEKRGFHLILQRTDKPLAEGLVSLYQHESQHVDKEIQNLPQLKKDSI